MLQYIILISAAASFVTSIVTLIVVLSRGQGSGDSRDMLRRIEEIRRDMLDDSRDARQENLQTVQSSMKALSEMLSQGLGRTAAAQDTRLAELNVQLTRRQETLQITVADMMKRMDARLDSSTAITAEKLEGIRVTVEQRLYAMQDEN
jgi:DNA recombination protein RmuC